MLQKLIQKSFFLLQTSFMKEQNYNCEIQNRNLFKTSLKFNLGLASWIRISDWLVMLIWLSFKSSCHDPNFLPLFLITSCPIGYPSSPIDFSWLDL